ncbi:MAG: 3-methyl-2-oxobutanoate hydroxymethyltransferase [Halobacteriovoraceae bacterium]|nr:3-methyl-2-oxobutanoate hydroxymethyltransferase [Halobacteriovoraceae bacterium]
MKKLNTKVLRKYKKANGRSLQALTCYDYQTARLLDQTSLDVILVGDSLGNVILGYKDTIRVSIEEMVIFSSAVKRGAPHKFVVADLPFGSYATLQNGLANSIKLFQKSGVEALKLEGAWPSHLELIKRLTQNGIPVVGHIGLTPQSVHEQGGYYIHGEDEESAKVLIEQAVALQNHGAFAIVLECVASKTAQKITKEISIPTIGIGSGTHTDGQVLVINDLFHLGEEDPPAFCNPIANLFQMKKELVEKYLNWARKTNLEQKEKDESHPYH